MLFCFALMLGRIASEPRNNGLGSYEKLHVWSRRDDLYSVTRPTGPAFSTVAMTRLITSLSLEPKQRVPSQGSAGTFESSRRSRPLLTDCSEARASPWLVIIRGGLQLRDVVAKEDHEDGGVSVSKTISLVKFSRAAG
jgi:hypothetical protein